MTTAPGRPASLNTCHRDAVTRPLAGGSQPQTNDNTTNGKSSHPETKARPPTGGGQPSSPRPVTRQLSPPQWPHLAPDRNSFMMDSRSFCGMSPCIDDTVKLASLIFSVSQSTYRSNWHT